MESKFGILNLKIDNISLDLIKSWPMSKVISVVCGIEIWLFLLFYKYKIVIVASDSKLNLIMKLLFVQQTNSNVLDKLKL